MSITNINHFIGGRSVAGTSGRFGDVFDPNQHEAILQQPTPGATAETVLDVVETGYMLGLTQVRAAKVVVAVPAD